MGRRVPSDPALPPEAPESGGGAADGSIAQELARAFLKAVDADGVKQDLGGAGDLGSRLASLFHAGRSAWPDLSVPAEDFARLVAGAVAADPGAAVKLEKLKAADLYLVCAYARGDARASQIFEEQLAPKVLSALRRSGTDEATREDVLQDLRAQLARALSEGEASGYQGRGDLRSWLCVCAVRAAGKRRARAAREILQEELVECVGRSAESDPELAAVSRLHREHFVTAFQDGLASLKARDRNLLRYRFVHGLSVEQVAALYKVHRVTMHRWLETTVGALRAQVRAALSAHLKATPATVDSLLKLVDTTLEGSLAVALPERDVEPE